MIKLFHVLILLFISIYILNASPLPETHHRIQKRNLFGANSSLSFIPDLLSLIGSSSSSDPSEGGGGINISAIIPLIGPITTAIINGIKIGLFNSSFPAKEIRLVNPFVSQPALYQIRPIVYGENVRQNQPTLETSEKENNPNEPYLSTRETPSNVDSNRVKREESLVPPADQKDTNLGITIREVHRNLVELTESDQMKKDPLVIIKPLNEVTTLAAEMEHPQNVNLSETEKLEPVQMPENLVEEKINDLVESSMDEMEKMKVNNNLGRVLETLLIVTEKEPLLVTTELNKTDSNSNNSQTFVVQKDAKHLIFHIQENPGDFMIQIEEILTHLMDHFQERFDHIQMELIPKQIVEQMDKSNPNKTIVIVLPKPKKSPTATNVSIDDNYSEVTLSGSRKSRQAPFWDFVSFFTSRPEPYRLRPIIFNVPSEQKMSTINILQSLSNILGENSDTISALTTFNVTQDSKDENFLRSSQQRGFYKESITKGQKDGNSFAEKTHHFAQERIESNLDNSVRYRRKRQIDFELSGLPSASSSIGNERTSSLSFGSLNTPSSLGFKSNTSPLETNPDAVFDLSKALAEENSFKNVFEQAFPNREHSGEEYQKEEVSNLQFPSDKFAFDLQKTLEEENSFQNVFEQAFPNREHSGEEYQKEDSLESLSPIIDNIPNNFILGNNAQSRFSNNLPNINVLEQNLPLKEASNEIFQENAITSLPVFPNLGITSPNTEPMVTKSGFLNVFEQAFPIRESSGAIYQSEEKDTNIIPTEDANLAEKNSGNFVFDLQKALKEENSFKNVFEQAFPNKEHSGEEYQKEVSTEASFEVTTAGNFIPGLHKEVSVENNIKNIFQQSFPGKELVSEIYQENIASNAASQFEGSLEDNTSRNAIFDLQKALDEENSFTNVFKQAFPNREHSGEEYQKEDSTEASFEVTTAGNFIPGLYKEVSVENNIKNIFEQSFPGKELASEIYQENIASNAASHFEGSFEDNTSRNVIFDLQKALDEENSFKNVFEQAFPNREHSGEEYQKEDSSATSFETTSGNFIADKNNVQNIFEQAFPTKEHSDKILQEGIPSSGATSNFKASLEDNTSGSTIFDLQKALEEENSFKNVFEQAFPNREHSGEEYQKVTSSGSTNLISKSNLEDSASENFAFDLQKALSEENSYINVFEQAFPNREHSGEEYQKEDTLETTFDSASRNFQQSSTTDDIFAFDLKKSLDKEFSFKNVFEQAFPNREHSGEEYQKNDISEVVAKIDTFVVEGIQKNDRSGRLIQGAEFINVFEQGFPLKEATNEIFQNEPGSIDIKIAINGRLPGSFQDHGTKQQNQDQMISVQRTFEQAVPTVNLNNVRLNDFDNLSNFGNILEQKIPTKEPTGEVFQESNSHNDITILAPPSNSDSISEKLSSQENFQNNDFISLGVDTPNFGSENLNIQNGGTNLNSGVEFSLGSQNSGLNANLGSLSLGSQKFGSLNPSPQNVASQNIGLGANLDSQNLAPQNQIQTLGSINMLPQNMGLGSRTGSFNLGSQNLGIDNLSLQKLGSNNQLVQMLNSQNGPQNTGLDVGLGSQNLGYLNLGVQNLGQFLEPALDVRFELGSQNTNSGSTSTKLLKNSHSEALISEMLGHNNFPIPRVESTFTKGKGFQNLVPKVHKQQVNLGTNPTTIPPFISKPQLAQNASMEGFLYVVPNLKDPLDFESKDFSQIQTNVALSPESLLPTTQEKNDDNLPKFDEIPLEQSFFDKVPLKNSYGEIVAPNQRK